MKVNDKIKLDEDCKSREAAKAVAAEHIKWKGYDISDVHGYIYVVGPTVSDLFILRPANKIRVDGKTKPNLTACTDEEWGKYFYTFVSSAHANTEKKL